MVSWRAEQSCWSCETATCRKRLREKEEPLPLPKPKLKRTDLQRGKGGSGQANSQAEVETYNRFLPLEDLETSHTLKAQCSFSQSRVQMSTPKIKQTLLAEEAMPDPAECLRSEQLHLIIRTLHCIFKKMDAISLQVSNLMQKVGNPEPNPLQSLPYERKPPVDQPPKVENRRKHKYCSNNQLNKQVLVLHPKKICLSIWNGTRKWLNLEGAKDCLSKILKIKHQQIDLHAVLPLLQRDGLLKVILAFHSSEIPFEIVRRKKTLATINIIPTRVFVDNTIKPLLCRVAGNTPPRAECPIISRNEIDTQSSQSNLPPLRTSEGPDPDNLQTSLDENALIISFGDLPLKEQAETIQRLDMLKSQFLQVHNKIKNQNNLVATCLLETDDLLQFSPIPKSMVARQAPVMQAMPEMNTVLREASPPPLQINLDPLSLEIPVMEDVPTHRHDPNYPSTHSSMPDLEPSSTSDKITSNLQMNIQRSSLSISGPPRGTRSPQQTRDDPTTILQDFREDLIEDPMGHINKIIQPPKEIPVSGTTSADPFFTPLSNAPLHLSTFSEKLIIPGQGVTSSGTSVPTSQLNHPNKSILLGCSARSLPSQRKITDFLGAEIPLNSEPLPHLN
nr:uncharacterized protein LOC118091683 [Zootoca vivipara]